MIIAPGFVGIDISQQHLDVFDGAAKRIANTADAIATQLEAWRGMDVFVLFEATGRYDLALRQGLEQAGIAHARVNPARARDFARATGTLAKTDAIDARMLAAMAQALRPQPRPAPDADRRALADLHARRDQLVGMRKAERTRLHTAPESLKPDLVAHMDWLDQHILAIETRIKALLASNQTLAQASALLRSIPGIGPVCATTILALMPEAGTLCAKTAAALAGLAPFNADSGSFKGKRSIRGGRPRLTQACYMAALSAIRTDSRFAKTFNTLVAAGKPAKLALIAVARKIIVTANAILKTNTPFAN